jgi:hypothetical protein
MSDSRLNIFYRLAGPLALVFLGTAFAYRSLAGWSGIAVLSQLTSSVVLAGIAGFKASRLWFLLCGLSIIALLILLRMIAI